MYVRCFSRCKAQPERENGSGLGFQGKERVNPLRECRKNGGGYRHKPVLKKWQRRKERRPRDLRACLSLSPQRSTSAIAEGPSVFHRG